MPISRHIQVPRRRSLPRSEASDSASLTVAMEEVRRVFAARARPYTVQYCTHCFEPRQMSEFLVRKPEELSADELEPILMDAYWTWGNWPALAHYMPRMLELYARGELWDPGVLFQKLLLAARPELITVGSTKEQVRNLLGEVMRPEERKAVFAFVRCVADGGMANPDLFTGVDALREAFAFLAAFDAPLSPVIETWRNSSNAVVRRRFCLFLAEWALRYDPTQRVLQHGYLDRLTPHRNNIRALARLVEPVAVEAYLSRHLSELERFDTDLLSTVGVALDWARCAQLGEESAIARHWKENSP